MIDILKEWQKGYSKKYIARLVMDDYNHDPESRRVVKMDIKEAEKIVIETICKKHIGGTV